MLGSNEEKYLVQHESCECKYGLHKSVSNLKQEWNHDKFQCECKSLDDWSSCRDDYIWNPSTCTCDCNKSWKIDKYLDTKNCSCKKHLFGKLVLACEDEILNTTEISLIGKKTN